MQKKLLLIVFIAFSVIDANAQGSEDLYSKGNLSLSSSLPYGGFWGGNFVLGLNMRPGIFVFDKLNLGVELGGTFTSNNYYNVLYTEPSLKYYLLPKRITPVIKAGYKFGRFHQENTESFFYNPTVGIGALLINSKGNFTVETGLNYDFNGENIRNNINPYLSFGIILGWKKKHKIID